MRKIVSIVILLIFTGMNIAAADNQPSQNYTHIPRGIMLCVSLGMPDQVLRQYLRQANELQIPIIIRGMVNNNLKDTSKRIFTLLNPKNEPMITGGVAIDPRPFRLANIQAVPALIVSDGYDFDVVSGNSSLTNLLEVVEKNGSNDELTEMSQEVLAKVKKDEVKSE